MVTDYHRRWRRRVFGISLLFSVGLAGFAIAKGGQADPIASARQRYEASFGGSFTLTGSDGKTVTERRFSGRPFAVFFGFTRCPDVCPTTLTRLARLRRQMGPSGDELKVLFITVDPENDTPAEIRRYLELFDEGFIGATGTEAQLKDVRARYQAIARKVPQDGGSSTIDHSATTFLMGRRGEFLTTIDAHEPDQTALAKLQTAVR